VQQDPTPDLLPDTLAALSAIMVAQAQEAIYIKAEKGSLPQFSTKKKDKFTDKLKPASLLKNAAKSSEFYNEAQKLMSRENVKGIWEKVFALLLHFLYFSF